MNTEPMIRFNATSELFEYSWDHGVTWGLYATAAAVKDDSVCAEAGRNYNPAPSIWSRYEGWLVFGGLVMIAGMIGWAL